MAKIDLSKMSLDELKKLEKDTGKAIKGFEERQRKEALAAAEAAVSKYGYSLAELTGTSRKKPKSAPPKYAHPENPSLIWSGRGRQPAWFKEAIENGKSEQDLLIG
ncbi:MAG: DNA-binding protein H-NS [Rhodobacteraceae bacterium HLUCCO18]|nr:MAG: DNA-binding protein H-NS [Rhodobacteraceae bacterium HLUCCO18]